MHYHELIPLFKNHLPQNVNLFVDAGNVGAQIMHHIPVNGKNICYLSLGMGAMGNSIGVAIGAAVTAKKQSVVFIGDGSLLMHGLEIHTAVEYQLPVVFLVFNNQSHGMCTTREQIFFQQTTGVNDFQDSHFAQGFQTLFPGLVTYLANHSTELDFILQNCFQHQGPVLVEIKISNEEIPPFMTFQNKG